MNPERDTVQRGKTDNTHWIIGGKDVSRPAIKAEMKERSVQKENGHKKTQKAQKRNWMGGRRVIRLCLKT